MTAIRSATSVTTPKSWVMNRMPWPWSSFSSRTSWRMRAWVVTSSAVVGSSAISSAGFMASAMAMTTRWHWPPEIWCG